MTANEREHLELAAVLRGKDLLLDEKKNRGILDAVAFHAGDNYRDAVRLCFFPSKDEEEKEPEASVYTQMEIVRLLEQQKC